MPLFRRNQGKKSGDGVAGTDNDPHNLHERFIRTHLRHFDSALREIKAGRKQSCWSWYIIPTPPWIVNGVERGSGINREYALRGDAQVHAYLALKKDGVDLRANYIAMMRAIAEQLAQGVKPVRLMGVLDDPKLRSSVKLFERCSRGDDQDGLHSACCRVLQLLDEKPEGGEGDEEDEEEGDEEEEEEEEEAEERDHNVDEDTDGSESERRGRRAMSESRGKDE